MGSSPDLGSIKANKLVEMGILSPDVAAAFAGPDMPGMADDMAASIKRPKANKLVEMGVLSPDVANAFSGPDMPGMADNMNERLKMNAMANQTPDAPQTPDERWPLLTPENRPVAAEMEEAGMLSRQQPGQPPVSVPAPGPTGPPQGMPPDPRQAAAPLAGGGGMAGRPYMQAAQESRRLGGELGDRAAGAYTQRNESISSQGEAEYNNQQRMADAYVEEQAAALTAQKEQADIQTRIQGDISEKNRRVEASREAWMYKDPERAENARMTLSNPEATPEQKKAAEATLAVGKDKFDPGRFMGEQTWQRVLSVIGMSLSAGMGAFASAYTGQNPAQNTINSMISNGLAQEEARMAQKERSGGKRTSYLERLVDDLDGDLDSAKDAWKESAHRAVAMKMEGLKSQGMADSAVAQADDIISQNTQQAEMAKLGYDEKMGMDAANKELQGRLMNQQQRAAEQQAAMEASQPPAWTTDPEFVIDGQEYTGKIKMSLKKVAEHRDERARLSTFLGNVDKAIPLVGTNLGPDARAKAQSAMGQVKADMKNIMELGVLSDSDMEFLKDVVGDGNVAFTDAQQLRLESIRETAVRKWTATSTSRGLTEKEFGQRGDAKQQAMDRQFGVR